MNLHEKAKKELLKDEDFSLITTDMLNEAQHDGNTVWHMAAGFNCLDSIPKHLFTEESMNLKNQFGETVLHIAALSNTLKNVPKEILTYDSLMQKKLIKGKPCFILPRDGIH